LPRFASDALGTPPATDGWVKDFLTFYGIGAGGGGGCVFNSAMTTVDAVVGILSDQADLAGYLPSPHAKSIAGAMILQPPDVISGADPKAEATISVDTSFTRGVQIAWDAFLAMLQPSTAAQWNAFRSSGGPVPPSVQYNFNLTLNGYLFPDKSSGNLKINWIGEPSVSVIVNSSGPLLSDQYAFNILKAHYDLKALNTSLEGSVAAVAQGILFGGPAQGGGQAQIVAAPNKIFSVGIGGAAMGNSSGMNFSLFGVGTVSF
jgi:hypothetical protein